MHELHIFKVFKPYFLQELFSFLSFFISDKI